MIKVAGLWELGWSAPLTEFDLWNFMLRAFEVDEWCMSPVSGINREVTERNKIQDFVDENPHLSPVCIDECGEIPLREFEHPPDALYLVGKVGRSILPLGHESVRVEAPCKDIGLPWPHQIMAIVLYDRQVKSWHSQS